MTMAYSQLMRLMKCKRQKGGSTMYESDPLDVALIIVAGIVVLVIAAVFCLLIESTGGV